MEQLVWGRVYQLTVKHQTSLRHTFHPPLQRIVFRENSCCCSLLRLCTTVVP